MTRSYFVPGAQNGTRGDTLDGKKSVVVLISTRRHSAIDLTNGQNHWNRATACEILIKLIRDNEDDDWFGHYAVDVPDIAKLPYPVTAKRKQGAAHLKNGTRHPRFSGLRRLRL